MTDELACIGLRGPAARNALGQATDDSLDNDTFPYLTARQITVAGKPVWAQRVSYIGELGWELYLANDDAGAVWDALLELGQAQGIRPAGYKALDSLRLEKGYVYWSTDVTPADNLLEAGLGFCADMTKADFIGRDALAKRREEGLQSRLRTVVLEDNEFPAHGAESVWHDGEIVLTVAQRRPRPHDRSIHRLRLPAAAVGQAGDGGGDRIVRRAHPGQSLLPIHDPKGERLKA